MKKVKQTIPVGVNLDGYIHIAKIFIEQAVRLAAEGRGQEAREQKTYAFKNKKIDKIFYKMRFIIVGVSRKWHLLNVSKF